MTLYIAALALLVDLAVGDPTWLPHPVIWMGRYIAWYERHWNGWQGAVVSRWRQRLTGVLLLVSAVCLAAALTLVVLWLALHVSFWLAFLLQVWLVATTIAWRGLTRAGQRVERALGDAGLVAARREVGQIVGRDTDALDEPAVIRAAVETLAENIVDAIVSPLFYACLGGAPLALVYRCVNTLDSMVGHKSARYIDFGWASARMDDVLNFVPARLTAALLSVVFLLPGYRFGGAWRALLRDAKQHPSPNSGIPEALVAGALGVRLGGTNYYAGVASQRALMGEPLRPLARGDIRKTVLIVHLLAILLLILLALGGGMLWHGCVRCF